MGYNKPGAYTIPLLFTVTNPNSNTWFFGNAPIALTLVEGDSRLYFPRAGIIRAAIITTTVIGGVPGTAEAWPMKIRKNATTDYLVDTQSISQDERLWRNYALNISVGLTDYIEIKTETPAWVTPPTFLCGHGELFIEYE